MTTKLKNIQGASFRIQGTLNPFPGLPVRIVTGSLDIDIYYSTKIHLKSSFRDKLQISSTYAG